MTIMDVLFLLRFVVDIVMFVFVCVVYFYLPGRYLLRKLSLVSSTDSSPFISFVSGILLFTFLMYCLSFNHAYFLIIPITILVDYLELRNRKYGFAVHPTQRKPLAIVLFMGILFSLSIVLTGVFGNTITNRSDDVIHLAYIREMIHHFPPDNPGFAGVKLQGYHFFYDFLVASVHNISGVSVYTLYFQCFPLLVAVLWAFGVYAVVLAWYKRIDMALWAVFLTIYGGGFGYILRLQGHPNISLGNAFGINQPISALLNPPFAISLILVVTALYTILQYQNTGKWGWLFVLAFCAGLSFMFKVYAGIIIGSGFVMLVVHELLQRKFRIMWPIYLYIILVALTFLVFSGKGNALIWAPLWAPHKVLNELLPWYGFAEKQYTYYRLNVLKEIVHIEFDGLMLFVFGNLGTRVVGIVILVIGWLKIRKPISLFAQVLLVMTLVSIGIPLFFLQSGKVFEIIQFAWYYLFLVSLSSAVGISMISDLKLIKPIPVILFVVFVVATIPSSYEYITKDVVPYFFVESRTPMIGQVWDQYRYIASVGTYDDTLMELPDTAKPTENNVNGWFRNTMPYFTAFGEKRSFLHSQNIDFANVDRAPRVKLITNILLTDVISPEEATYSALLKTVKDGLMEYEIVYIVSPRKLFMMEQSGMVKNQRNIGSSTVYRTK
jgi:hypothetical protein